MWDSEKIFVYEGLNNTVWKYLGALVFVYDCMTSVYESANLCTDYLTVYKIALPLKQLSPTKQLVVPLH